jgi:hypothetical protein
VKEGRTKSKRQKKASARKLRFPRLYLTAEMVIAERILHHTYNKLSEARSSSKSYGVRWYDIYKTKNGLMAPVKFMMLAQDLTLRRIDPAVYLRIMSQYGVYQNTTFLPHPSWLASRKALKVYKWLRKRTLAKYQNEYEAKQNLDPKKSDQIKMAMESSASMVGDVKKTFHLKLYEAMIFLHNEISPWYWATFISLLKRRSRRDLILEYLYNEHPDLRKSVILCTKYFLANRHVWRMACSVLRKHLATASEG